MTTSSLSRAQTTKQAKAAYKVRGPSHISDSERKRLLRGAELLKRADRLRAQEAKKREWSKKREDEQGQDVKGNENLGSQRRLDKFGYASSQFHLGKFFAPGKAAKKKESVVLAGPDQPSAPVRREDEGLSKDGQDSLDTRTGNEDHHKAAATELDAAEETPSSPLDADFFLETSDEASKIHPTDSRPPLAAIDGNAPRCPDTTSHILPKPPPAKKRMVSFPSLTSEDGLFEFDDEIVAQCDRAVLEMQQQQQDQEEEEQRSCETRLEEGKAWGDVSPKIVDSASAGTSNARAPGMMLPPPLPFAARSKQPSRSTSMPDPSVTKVQPITKPDMLNAPTTTSSATRPVYDRAPQSWGAPPPRPPLRAQDGPAGSFRPAPRPTSRPQGAAPIQPLAAHGISAADLDELASMDFVLSQMPARH